jgi:hypothetical protein
MLLGIDAGPPAGVQVFGIACEKKRKVDNQSKWVLR